MPRSPLFREEDKLSQNAYASQQLKTPQISKCDATIKGGQNDALWNRMNVAMRLSCQRIKPLKK